MAKSIKRIPIEVSNVIRASSVLQSLHNAVEEILYNSIDARSTYIEICVDFDSLSFKVVDNGDGIAPDDLRNFCGEWNCTTKQGGGHYGRKGEAIAAISQLARRVEVRSRQSHSAAAHTKRISRGDDGAAEVAFYSDTNCGNFRGTVVVVESLFCSLPVRARSSNPDVEAGHLRELLRRMSVLHHSVEWLLVDTTGDEVVLCRHRSESSVPRRFAALHGQAALTGMDEVSQICGPFAIHGLLSAPLSVHCQLTRRCQYCYLNTRWLRNSDTVAQLLNQLYTRTMAGSHNAGGVAKHQQAENEASDRQRQRMARFPSFVLQVACAEQEVDVLCEPDKTCALFRRPDLLRQCVVSLARGMFERHSPDLLPAFDRVVGQLLYSAVEAAPRADCKPSREAGRELDADLTQLIGDGDGGGDLGEYGSESPAMFKVQQAPPGGTNLFDCLRYDEEQSEQSEQRLSPQSKLFQVAFGGGTDGTVTPRQLTTRGSAVEPTMTHKRSRARCADRREPKLRLTGPHYGPENSPFSGHLASDETVPPVSEAGVTVRRACGATTGQLSSEEQFDALLSSHSQDVADQQCGWSAGVPFDHRATDVWTDCLALSNSPAENCFRHFALDASPAYECLPAARADLSGHTPDPVYWANHGSVGDWQPPCQSPAGLFQTIGDDQTHDVEWWPEPVVQTDCPLSGKDDWPLPLSLDQREPLEVWVESSPASPFAPSEMVVAAPFDVERTATSDHKRPEQPAPDVCVVRRGDFVSYSLAPPAATNEASDSASVSQTEGQGPELYAALSRPATGLNRDFSAESGATHSHLGEISATQQTAVLRSLNLRKDCLHSLKLVGQCDAKFLLATVDRGDGGSVLLAIDQHAADERVNLELMAAQASADKETSFAAVDEWCVVGEEERAVLQRRVTLFLSWHFEYCISLPAAAAKSGGTHGQYDLHLMQTPTVLGEPLGVHDLLEFARFVGEDGRLQLPDALLRPPVVQRILASRACHSSVRFGDMLPNDVSERLLTRLADTAQPFQCAHGRPSISVLEDLTAARDAQVAERRSRGRELMARLFEKFGAVP